MVDQEVYVIDEKDVRTPQNTVPKIYSFIGMRIFERRNARGLTQIQLAKSIGVTQQQIQKNEKGLTRLSVEKLIALAEALEAPVSYFLKGLGSVGALSDQEQESFPMDKQTVSLLHNFSALENPASRAQVLGMVEHFLEIEKMQKSLKNDG